MPGLLITCPVAIGDPIPCCEQPYTPTTADGVRACLIGAVATWSRPAVLTDLRGAELFGRADASWTAVCRAQDLQLLVELLYMLFQERVRDKARDGEEKALSVYWDSYKLDKVARYFTCTHGINVAPIFLHAGMYDPRRRAPSGVDLETLPAP